MSTELQQVTATLPTDVPVSMTRDETFSAPSTLRSPKQQVTLSANGPTPLNEKAANGADEEIGVVVAANDTDLLRGRTLIVLWSIFLLSIFLVALDNTVVSTAIPKLTSEFNALNNLSWVVSAYLLTQASFMLIYGQLLTILPTKWVLLSCISIFELGSLVCGVAPSMNVLIFGRAFAGVGSSGILISILTVMSTSTMLEYRPILLGTFAAVFSFASIVGPLIGGVLTDRVTWRWCFYINLPLGVMSVVAIVLLLPLRPATPNPLYDGKTIVEKILALDLFGGVLSIAMITSLLLPLQWGGNIREWNDPVVIALLATFGILIIIFGFWERYMADYAIIPPNLVKNRTQTAATIEVFLIFFAFLIGAIWLAFLYQSKGASAMQSGIDVIPFSVAYILGTALSAGVISATGHYKPFLICGPWFSAIAGGLLYMVDPSTSDAKLVGYQIILGFGIGLSVQNPLNAIQAEFTLRPELIPQASAIASFSQLLGGTIGITVAGTVFSNQLSLSLTSPINTGTNVLSPELIQAVRQSITVIFDLPLEERQPIIEAYVHSVAVAFLPIVPALVIAGLVGFGVRGWNLKRLAAGM